MKRVEAKIDHLEKRLVKNPLSKLNAAETIGRTLGNFAGQGDLGAMAGSSLAKFFGHGDYTVKSNSLMMGAPSQAKFSSHGKRGTRIVEREYLGDIISGPLSGASTQFTVQSFTLNPTNITTFPWLSRMANLYDQWEPNGIVFEYVSTSSEYNGSSQALGAVIMATDYDSYDPVYGSKQAMENADYACSTKPANGLLHGIECDPNERPTPLLYTSTVNGAPLTSTNLAVFQVATQGCSTAGVTLGELWVSYDITFYKKQIYDNINLSPFITSSGALTGATGPIISAAAANAYQISLTQVVGTGTRIDLNNSTAGGRYLVEYFILVSNAGVDGSLSSSTVSNGTKSGVRDIWDTAGTGNQIYLFLVDASAPNTSIFFNQTSRPATSYAFSVVQVPKNYVA